jgi:uncharacterized membrane protein
MYFRLSVSSWKRDTKVRCFGTVCPCMFSAGDRDGTSRIKGVAGIVEMIGGLLFLFIPQANLNTFVVLLTAPELAEDPTDQVALLLQRTVHELAADTKLFASGYLIIHGLIKVFLVAGLLRRRLWSYSVSLLFLMLFIVYQCYRFFFTHSLWLIVLTIIDLVVAFLIWREYQARKQQFE